MSDVATLGQHTPVLGIGGQCAPGAGTRKGAGRPCCVSACCMVMTVWAGNSLIHSWHAKPNRQPATAHRVIVRPMPGSARALTTFWASLPRRPPSRPPQSTMLRPKAKKTSPAGHGTRSRLDEEKLAERKACAGDQQHQAQKSSQVHMLGRPQTQSSRPHLARRRHRAAKPADCRQQLLVHRLSQHMCSQPSMQGTTSCSQEDHLFTSRLPTYSWHSHPVNVRNTLKLHLLTLKTP